LILQFLKKRKIISHSEIHAANEEWFSDYSEYLFFQTMKPLFEMKGTSNVVEAKITLTKDRGMIRYCGGSQYCRYGKYNEGVQKKFYFFRGRIFSDLHVFKLCRIFISAAILRKNIRSCKYY